MEDSDSRIVVIVQALVRPIVTILFSCAMTYGWLHDKLSDDAFIGIAGIVIGFWFQARSGTTPHNGGSASGLGAANPGAESAAK